MKERKVNSCGIREEKKAKEETGGRKSGPGKKNKIDPRKTGVQVVGDLELRGDGHYCRCHTKRGWGQVKEKNKKMNREKGGEYTIWAGGERNCFWFAKRREGQFASKIGEIYIDFGRSFLKKSVQTNAGTSNRAQKEFTSGGSFPSGGIKRTL